MTKNGGHSSSKVAVAPNADDGQAGGETQLI